MKFSIILASFAALGARCNAAGVIGKPEGFAASTTGGGNAIPASPADITQLTEWLTDDVARVIVLDKEFVFQIITLGGSNRRLRYNFIESEGRTTAKGCRPASNTCPGRGGQDAINGASWCTDGLSGFKAKPMAVTYDAAAITSINLGSNKSIVGVGSAGVIRGKGLRIANGAKNIIIQNIHITELNPQYIWGGDAITLAGTDLVWIDHVKTSLIGRQHLVTGPAASNRVTISNNEFDGITPWSASCDNHQYWAIYFTGCDDLVTFKGNYIHHTSGRSPKITGKTLVHAVNNYWYANSGHAFDIGVGSMVLAEGNMFEHVDTPLLRNEGQLFSSPSIAASTVCSGYLGRNCEHNSLGSSGEFSGDDTGFLSIFKGKVVASAGKPSADVAITAGIGRL